jgi:hypothetical protein
MSATTTTSTFRRTAHPYRDTDVIDARAPRFNQVIVGLASLLAVVTGWWPLLALLAAQLAIGLRFGRRWCVACVVYFELIQPRLGEGPIEDSRPPRFANVIGLVVLSAASLAYLAGATLVGAALGLLVAGLALLAAVTGFCTGCWIYRLLARVQGVRRQRLDRVALAELGIVAGGDEHVVAFTHPLCTDCRELVDRFAAEGRALTTVDVRDRPELARRYGVSVVPLAFRVDGEGRVVQRIAG